ncbi:MAG: cytochrome C biogenesis protein [Hyphomicrobiales bacterium]|nr:MAG: cytochrome C biogenesis protein [Hyphomicrobiales bacterium]
MEFEITYTGALLAGLISFASPCVLPLVPPYLCFIAGVSVSELSEDDRSMKVGRRVMSTAVAFILGFATVFVALGASASYLGAFVSEYLEELGMIAGVVIIVLGLHFLGVFRIALLFREARFQTRSKPMGLPGAYVVGLAFAFGWTPCVGPILAAILFVAGSEADVFKGASLLFVYAMGIGIPFLLAAAFAGSFMKFMARFRKHLGLVEKIMGAALVIVGVMFLTGAMQSMSFFLLEYFPQLGAFG